MRFFCFFGFTFKSVLSNVLRFDYAFRKNKEAAMNQIETGPPRRPSPGRSSPGRSSSGRPSSENFIHRNSTSYSSTYVLSFENETSISSTFNEQLFWNESAMNYILGKRKLVKKLVLKMLVNLIDLAGLFDLSCLGRSMLCFSYNMEFL